MVGYEMCIALLATYDVVFLTPFEVEMRLRTAAGGFLILFQVVWILIGSRLHECDKQCRAPRSARGCVTSLGGRRVGVAPDGGGSGSG